jgi:hypothetical protein
MQIDMIWLRKWFAIFNQQYFDGQLPTPRFHIGHSRTQLGTMSYKRQKRLFGSRLSDLAIGMSNYYDQTEHQFQSVLLHEMIHLSIAASGVKDTSPHGVVFRGMMDRLNRDGWKISVTTSTRDRKPAYTGNGTTISQYLVLALTTRDGLHFLSSVNPKFARSIESRVSMAQEVKQHAWYTTHDRWFENMPKVRSLRGRRVTTEVWKEKIDAMKEIHFN